MLPRHLKEPFTMMASRVHRASHSSMLAGKEKNNSVVSSIGRGPGNYTMREWQ